MWEETEDVSPWKDLRRQIIELPEDDDLRLQFASEWESVANQAASHEDIEGETTGVRPERAWLIRLQIRLDKLPNGASHPEWFRLRTEVNRLLLSNERYWTPSWFAAAGVSEPAFSRGFIEGVTAESFVLLDGNARRRLFECAPIRHLNVVGVERDADWESILNGLRSDGLGWRILSLSLDAQNLTDKAVDYLAASDLTSLVWLSAAYNRITESGVRKLADVSAYGRLMNLSYVNLQGNPADPVDEVMEDQGVVTGLRRPAIQDQLPQVRWLRREVSAGRVTEPDRFKLRTFVSRMNASHAAGAD